MCVEKCLCVIECKKDDQKHQQHEKHLVVYVNQAGEPDDVERNFQGKGYRPSHCRVVDLCG